MITTRTVGFVIDIDTEAIAPASVEVWLYQILNRIGYEHTVKSVTVDGATEIIANKQALYDLPLGEDKKLK